MAKKRVVDPMIVGQARRRGVSAQARHITIEDGLERSVGRAGTSAGAGSRSGTKRRNGGFGAEGVKARGRSAEELSDREALDRAFGIDEYEDRGKSRVDKRKGNSGKGARKTAGKAAGKGSGKKKGKKKIVKRIVLVIILLLVVGICGAGYYAWTLLNKTTAVFQGNALDILRATDLKRDENGRSNVLVFGTSEDDENHNGAMLTDSILVISADQDEKNAYQFSIPRDLWVTYGMGCSVGYQGKINATYMCALEENKNDKDEAAKYFAEIVSKITGMEIQYYVAVDYTVVKDVVDALGGVDVDVYSDDPRGIYDYQTKLKLSAGVNHLNGKQALLLARARNSHGGYGLSRSNFDREINQQRIIQAVQKKALNAGILADPGKVTGILDSLGDNIKTNVTMSELGKVLEVAGGLSGGVKSIDLTKQFTTGMVGNASVVMTTDGVGNYTTLQKFLAKKLEKKVEE